MRLVALPRTQRWLICVALFLSLLTLAACEQPDVATGDAIATRLDACHSLPDRVNDGAGILTPDFIEQTRGQLKSIEADTGRQLVLATTAGLDGKTIEDYSLALANCTGIGRADMDDGLMLLVAPSQKQVRIEVGFGMEALVTDDAAANIIATEMIPLFRASRYEAGIAAGLARLEVLIRADTRSDEELKAASRTARSRRGN